VAARYLARSPVSMLQIVLGPYTVSFRVFSQVGRKIGAHIVHLYTGKEQLGRCQLQGGGMRWIQSSLESL
jgi:hypothetical protein